MARAIALVLVLLIPVTTAALAGCSNGPASKESIVSMQDNKFEPQLVSIAPGETVVWVNRGGNAHRVSSDNATGPLHSPLLSPGESYRFKFTTAGVYQYHCDPHSAMGANETWAGMTALVLVER